MIYLNYKSEFFIEIGYMEIKRKFTLKKRVIKRKITCFFKNDIFQNINEKKKGFNKFYRINSYV